MTVAMKAGELHTPFVSEACSDSVKRMSWLDDPSARISARAVFTSASVAVASPPPR